jgi:tRNA(Ile)-lysidine synthase
LPSDERIVVGVSGGPDSTALVAVLAGLAKRRRSSPQPIVVCVHHGLREEADEECALVARLARRLGLPFERIDVRPGLRRGNVSANARQDRYAVLRDAAIRHGARLVATGHHAGDRLETMLLGLARGRGLRGLASPRWTRSLGQGVRLVRPLLDVDKEACVALCETLDLVSVDDRSNHDPARARGHLRRAVLPPLLSRYPTLALHASRASDEAAAALRALERLVARRFGPRRQREWERDRFRAADAVLASWALRRAAYAADPNFALLVPRSGWDRAARAARDGSERPRIFRWGRLCCVVRSDVVRLELLAAHH